MDWIAQVWALFKSFESLIILFGLFLAWHLLRRERLKIRDSVDELSQRIATSIQQSKAAIEAAETALAQPSVLVAANSNNTSHWETIRSEWQNVRDRLELAVERIPHKATRGKYGKLTRYNYNDLIIGLRDDGQIKSGQAFHALMAMNGLFNRLRARPSNATADHVEQFADWLRQVNGSLPKLPHPKVALASDAAE
jgi:hypothetical protein